MAAGAEELKAMQVAFAALEPLTLDERRRAVQWILGALGVDDLASGAMGGEEQGSGTLDSEGANSADSAPKAPTPKQFIASKKPTTAIERVACLAYYLNRYRKLKTFKSAQLTALNTEAAAPRFANASRDVSNADYNAGYIVGAAKGHKQITTRGEALVEALPDRAAVKAALAQHPFKRKKPSKANKKAPKN